MTPRGEREATAAAPGASAAPSARVARSGARSPRARGAHRAEPDGQGYPLGDVTGVYRVWAENAAHGLAAHGHRRAVGLPDPRVRPDDGALALGTGWYARRGCDRDRARRHRLLRAHRPRATLAVAADRGVVVARVPRRCSARSRSVASTRSPCRSRSPVCSGAAGRPRVAACCSRSAPGSRSGRRPSSPRS